MSNKLNQTKIAFLLMIHENPNQVNQFLKQLLSYQSSEIYIHVDIMQQQIKSRLLSHERIHVLEKSIHGKWVDYCNPPCIQSIKAFC